MRPDPKRRAEYGLPPEVHAIVEQVFPDSPAERAGLRRGDGLVSVQEVDGSDLTSIHRSLISASVGDAWKLEISRDGGRRTLEATLTPRPERPRLAALDALRFYGGIELAARKNRLEVTRVLSRTAAADERIQAGDVLEKVLIKKDLEHADQGVSRWRTVRDVEKLEKVLEYAYSDLDFFVGLRFKPARGPKRQVYLFEMLLGTNAF